MSRLFLTIALTLVIVTPASAEKNVKIDPKIASLGAPVAEVTFDDAGQIGKPMQAAKGAWKLADGVLHGKELKADEHAAVLNYQRKNRNSVVRFSFKLDEDTTGFHFSMNHKKGHLFRVIVSPTKMAVNLDKDKKDPTSKRIVLGSSQGQFEPGNWYTMQVEMVGEQVVVQVDNGASVKASHASLDTDKPNYRFVMRGNSLSIDDLRIWDVK